MTARLLPWLEEKSDWLSPIVVKEVRQVVRGREFAYSFAASLIAGLAVAFFGAADALSGAGTAGAWTFFTLMACIAFLGFAVVPLGAFSALRNERLEQTLELITLTELSPRRIVIGKLLAQAVKLVTLFAAIAPFVAMSFLLGGIDFVTIVLSLAGVFLWSLWACALCLFLSTLLKSRAMSGIVFGVVGLAMFMLLTVTRQMYFMFSRGIGFGGPGSTTTGFVGSAWWVTALVASFCIASMINLVLLAENRLALTENKVTTLRIGFMLQLLLVGAWMLSFLDATPRVHAGVAETLGVIGGIHLTLVALFAVTEDLVGSRRMRARVAAGGVHRLMAVFRPGGGRGALYVLLQMGMVLAFAQLFNPPPEQNRWLFAVFGYVCFFTGVPTVLWRAWRPMHLESSKVRVTILATLPVALVLPDLLYYLLWRPEVLSLKYSARHLINPLRTLANWEIVELQRWGSVPLVIGLTGVLAYAVLINLATRVDREAIDPEAEDSSLSAGQTVRADVND
jgi:hypothetical protein